MTKSLPIKWSPFYAALFVALGIYVAAGFVPPKPSSPFDTRSFARLPVLEGGRTKPMDSLARNSLLLISGKQSVRAKNRKYSATEWLLEMMFKPELANELEIFEIDDPDVRGLLGIEPGVKRRFSFTSILEKLGEVETQAAQAEKIKAEKRSRFQRSVLALFNKAVLYHRLQNSLRLAGETAVMPELVHLQEELPKALKAHATSGGSFETSGLELFFNRSRMLAETSLFAPLPLGKKEDGEMAWVSMGEGLLHVIAHGHFSAAALQYTQLGDAYASDNPEMFQQAVNNLLSELESIIPGALRQARDEHRFNVYSPFLRSMTLYIVVFLLVPLGWLFSKTHVQRAAFWILIGAFAVHTLGLLARMVLQGRPPVTNLYSSAIFVGWAAVLLSIVMEKLYRNGIGSFVGSLIGFATLIIAHHLATQGDTMEMMRAVLDSNFWLATHVVTITVGYSSTFLSGTMGAVYLARRAFDRSWTKTSADHLAKMVFGVVCFSAILSFIGTILGGIWADQSWGRFWGWDPKENGALMIVLWNAVILHVWRGRLLSEKAIMALAVFGNVITALSWFGVNMLGIGLHSYGFMDKAFLWLVAFSLAQLLIIGLQFLNPRRARQPLPSPEP